MASSSIAFPASSVGRKASALAYSLFCKHARCGSLIEARSAFDAMDRPNVVAWTFLINEHVKRRDMAGEALPLYCRMIQEGINPNHVTYLCVLKACALLGLLDPGKHVHASACANSSGFDRSVLGNALIDLYAKCGEVEAAEAEFARLPDRTLVSWNSLISGFVKNREFEQAFARFCEMRRSGGLEPDSVTFLSILKMCGSKKDSRHGKLAHSGVLKAGVEGTVFVENALVDMYCKCERLEDAKRVFERIEKPHIGAWNALIGGFAELGCAEEAVRIFKAMEAMELELGKVTYLSVLKALGALAALDRGREVQELIERSELEADLFIASNLVDMHAKCGNLEEAKKLFEKMPYRSSITWNTLISGYALDGQAMEAFRLAKRMMEEEEKGIDPNHITLVGLLLACSHAGLVEEGFACFKSICRLHGVLPAMEHYCCLVDALARAGCLADSLRVIELMPFEPNSTIWKALLGACRTCCDIDFARYVVDTSLAEPRDNATFVLLSNIFAAAGGWEALLTDTEEL